MSENNEEIHLNMVDVAKVNLEFGDVLLVTIKSDNLAFEDIRHLADGFRKQFPDNQVVLLNVEKTGEIKYTVASAPKAPEAPAPTANFCNDCGCGKKEAWESYSIATEIEKA